jgi:hypothetical protein
MKNEKKTIIVAFADFLLISFLVFLAFLVLTQDILVLGQGITENSLTELSQEALLLVSAVLFGINAWRNSSSRGFLVLVTGFFSCMLIRELDSLFDSFVYHGFWVWPALAVAFGSALYAYYCRHTITTPFAQYIGTKSYYHIFFGLVVILVLSRTFGSGNLLWKPIMGENYSSALKNTLQEGLELFGYFLVFSGSFLSLKIMKSGKPD